MTGDTKHGEELGSDKAKEILEKYPSGVAAFTTHNSILPERLHTAGEGSESSKKLVIGLFILALLGGGGLFWMESTPTLSPVHTQISPEKIQKKLVALQKIRKRLKAESQKVDKSKLAEFQKEIKKIDAKIAKMKARQK